MVEFLTNPWVISLIVISIIVGNIAAIKYTANMKFGPMNKRNRDLDRLTELDKKRQQEKEGGKL